jgi:hypothetical protein
MKTLAARTLLLEERTEAAIKWYTELKQEAAV